MLNLGGGMREVQKRLHFLISAFSSFLLPFNTSTILSLERRHLTPHTSSGCYQQFPSLLSFLSLRIKASAFMLHLGSSRDTHRSGFLPHIIGCVYIKLLNRKMAEC